MTFGRLLLRNLFYHWRGNLAVLLGVVVGSAVLTGALLVGDSLRGSLRDRAVQQLGRVDHVLVGGRLLRQELAGELAQDGAASRVVPALMLQGAITAGRGRSGRVAILGVGPTFWQLWPDGRPPQGSDFWLSEKREVVLNRALARDLGGVQAGDPVRLFLQKVSAVPRESILGRKEAGDVLDEVRLTVRAVLPDDAPGSQFNLNHGAAAPRNAFIPLAALQKELTRKRPDQPRPGVEAPVNALLVEGGMSSLGPSLAKNLRLEDWGLVLRGPKRRAEAFFRNLNPRGGVVRISQWPRLTDRAFAGQVAGGRRRLTEAELAADFSRRHPYLSLESRQLFIEPAVAEAAKEAARKTDLTAAPTLVYLADRIAAGPGRQESYAVVAALDPGLPPPLGPFLPPGVKRLGPEEIVLVNWPGTPLPPGGGVRRVALGYYGPEEEDLQHTRALRVAGWIPLQGAADDPDLTPEFPGITDKTSLQEWDPPASLHYVKKRVIPADEAYWKSYRTTPKAYVSLETGQKLWASRFGNLTSIRLAPAPRLRIRTVDLGSAETVFQKELLRNLRPEQVGLVFDPVRERVLGASTGSNDFGGLFLAFSVFIIVAALLLVGLLFRLNLERRAAEVGLLLAAGYPRRTVRRLLLAEGGLLAVAGGLIGCAGAVLYAWLLLDYLRSWWPGGLERSFLRLHAGAASFLIGYFASLLVSLLTIAWSLRVLGKVSPRALLAGETTAETDPAQPRRPGRWRAWVGGLCLAGAVGCVAAGFFTTDHEMQASAFFGSGLFLLVAGLIGVWSFLKRDRTAPSRHVAGLGVHNAARNPVRSLLTVGLLAAATFLVLAVESFHRDPGKDFDTARGGSGGFNLLGESDVPLFRSLSTREGRDDLFDALRQAGLEKEWDVVKQASFYSLRLRAGDDASCLNLAQPRRPRLLGVPRSLIRRGGFHFADSEAASPAERDNPWLLLERNLPDEVVTARGKRTAVRVVPVIGDATTVRWMLGSGLGREDVEVPDENGNPVRLRVVGLLEDSIFQSELLLSDAHFRQLYPHQEGFRFLLVQAPAGRAAEVRRDLEQALADHGLTLTPARQRIEAYLAVENTYLATFQALGGLGLLLGALGLAVVLLRSVWERRGELALLRALGFRRSALGWLVLAENGFLLVVGLAVGVVTALVSVTPPLLTGAGAVPWLRLLVLLALVLAVGLAAGAAAVASTLRAPLLPALRRE